MIKRYYTLLVEDVNCNDKDYINHRLHQIEDLIHRQFSGTHVMFTRNSPTKEIAAEEIRIGPQ